MSSAAVVLVGCGNMGFALLAGWLDQGVSPGAVCVVETAPEQAQRAADRGVAVISTPPPASGAIEVVVLAVKPQVLPAVAPDYAAHAAGGAAILSIAAGRSLASIEAAVGANAAVIRAMPNTPAAIRQGMTVACGNRAAAKGEHRARCQSLLEAVGKVAWVDDETLMDAVTALSGSGPAYIFFLAECLTRAGVAEGLPEALAEQLARQTVAGAGSLLACSPQPAATLRQNVTSPGGTTAAALGVLMDDAAGLAPLLARAVRAAAARSRELAG